MKRIEKLKVVRDTVKAVLAELVRVRKLKKASADDLEQVVRHGDLEDEKHLKRFADASFKKSVAPAKEAKLLKELSGLQHIWPDVWSAARHEWDKWVSDKQEAESQRLLVAVRPWFGGEEKEAITRLEFEGMHVPAIAEYRRFYAPDFSKDGATVEDFVDWADLFLAHIERVLGKTGWMLPKEKTDPTDLDIRLPEPKC